jgi:3-hydroxyanthranilate 3,4-dioxygenase
MPLDSINLEAWIDQNRESLKPPVGNKLLYGDGEFQVMIVAGPNTRRDFHCEPGEELFYQLKGDIMLKLIEDGVPRDVIIHEGDTFLLPANTIHSPRRPAGTLGMVVERQRTEDEEETITWYCETCGNLLYQFKGVITDLGTQLKPVMDTFWATPDLHTCKVCGAVMPPPTPATL